MYNYNVATTSVIFSQPLGHSLNQAVSQPVNEWGLQTIRKHTCLLSYQIQRNTPLCPAGAECYRVKSHAYRSCRNQPKQSFKYLKFKLQKSIKIYSFRVLKFEIKVQK